MLHHLGDFYYGVLMLANSVLSYHNLLGFGVSTSVQRFVALSRGSGERGVAGEALSAAVAIMIITAAATALMTGVIVVILPRLGLISANGVPLLRQALLLLGGSVAVSFPSNPIAAYLRGIHRFDLANGIYAGTAVLRALGIWIVLLLGQGIVAVCLVMLASSVASLLAHLLSVRIIDPGLLRLSTGFQWHRIRQLSRFSFYVFLTGIGDYLRFQVDLIIVAKWIGVQFVTPYSVALSLVLFYQNIMAGLSGPLMTELISEDRGQRNKRCTFFLQASKISALLAALGAVLLLANGHQLLSVWLGPKYVSVFSTLAVLTIAHWADRAQGPSHHLLLSRARHQPMAYWTVAEGLLNVGLSIYLGKLLGILGVAIGTAVPMLIIKLLVQPIYTIHVARERMLTYFGTVARPIAIGAFVLSLGFICAIHTSSVVALAFSVLWQTVLFLVLTYSFALTGEERQVLSERLLLGRMLASH
jgi:O-antigen/teichoic acid export membrane protein